MQIPRGAEKRGLVGEVRGVDHQGIAFPRPDGIAQPLAQNGRFVLRIHANVPGVVVHFVQDHYVILGLHDLLQVVVHHRQRGRPGAGPECQQTPLGGGAQLRVVVRAGRDSFLYPPRIAAIGTIELAALHGALASLRGHGWKAAVLRFGNNGGAPLAVDLEGPDAPIHPQRIVSAHVARRTLRSVSASWRRRAVRIALLIVFRHFSGLGLRQSLGFFVREGKPVAEFCRARQGCKSGDIVHAR